MVIGFKNDKGVKDRIFYPTEIPILPLRGTVAYPDLIMPLIVGRERSIRLVDEARILTSKILMPMTCILSAP